MLYIKPEDHRSGRIDVHPSQRQLHITPVSQPLYVACAISNPQRYHSRYRHFQAFEKHMAESGAVLYTVELALRDRHHEITAPENPRHIQLRSASELWHKENLLNIGVSRFPDDWHYGAVIDADFLMTRSDWATEAIHQLQHYRWVQLFSSYSDLTHDHQASRAMPSFATIMDRLNASEWATPYYGTTSLVHGAPGGAWAFRRDAFDDVGGLLDTCILGSADWHMAYSLAGKVNRHADFTVLSRGYVESLHEWADRAAGNRGSVGCVQNHAMHYWHGHKDKRAYATRVKILKKHCFDPRRDLKRDWQGVLSWQGNKAALEEDVRQYFRSRDEDAH